MATLSKDNSTISSTFPLVHPVACRGRGQTARRPRVSKEWNYKS